MKTLSLFVAVMIFIGTGSAARAEETCKDCLLIGSLSAMAAGGLYLADDDIRHDLQGVRSGPLGTATDIGSNVGDPFLHLGIAALVIGTGKFTNSEDVTETGILMGESLLMADAATLILKEGVGRGRPFAAGQSDRFRPLDFKSDYDSFPSAHAASSFALASVISSRTDSIPVTLAAYSAATFVGFSRMYQDKHWASDIIAGAAIGEISARIVSGIRKKRGSLLFLPAVSKNGAMITFGLRL